MRVPGPLLNAKCHSGGAGLASCHRSGAGRQKSGRDADSQPHSSALHAGQCCVQQGLAQGSDEAAMIHRQEEQDAQG